MSVVLDSPVRVGTLWVAAISRIEAGGRAGRAGVAVAGVKTPLAVLVCEGGTTRAFDMAGEPLDEAAVELLCAGAWRRVSEAR